MSLTRRMPTAIQAGLEASARRAPAYGVGPPVSVDGFTANSFTRHVPARYTSSCCQLRISTPSGNAGWLSRSLSALYVEGSRANAIDADDDGNPLLFLVGVLFDLPHTTPHLLPTLRIVDDPGCPVEAERAPVACRVPNEDSDARVGAERCEGLPLRPFPPCQMVFVPHHQAALQCEVWLALVRRRDEAGGERLLVIGARVVDDVREQQKVNLGDRRDRRSGGHPPTLTPRNRGQFPRGDHIERETRCRASGEDRKGQLRISRPRSAHDRGRGLRRAHARAAVTRSGAPRARHAGVADPAGRRAGLDTVRAGAARRADALPVERVQRGGAPRLRPARAEASRTGRRRLRVRAQDRRACDQPDLRRWQVRAGGHTW